MGLQVTAKLYKNGDGSFLATVARSGSVPHLSAEGDDPRAALNEIVKQLQFLGLTGRLKVEKQWPDDPVPKQTDRTDFSPVLDMLRKASQNLKYPKIRLSTYDGNPVVLYIAGEKSKYCGQVQITDGGPYGDNQYYGRIDKEGNLHASRSCNQEIMDLLLDLARNPEGTAQEYGHRTGNCCFCAKTLTNDRSVELGYGPICAGHYGLEY